MDFMLLSASRNSNALLLVGIRVGYYLLMVGLGISVWAKSQDRSARTLIVPVVEQAPVLDGKLDDPCWQKAVVARDFTYSRIGAPASQKTEVYICQDARHLHIAFHCLDDRPDGIAAYQRHRDGPMEQDDYVEVWLDTTNRRIGFSTFQVNPLGTQRDQMEGGTATKVEWKGDWRAAASITADGWVSEISIPYSILKYSQGTDSFGVNFRRHHQRLQEDDY